MPQGLPALGPLRVLMIEDSAEDAELLQDQLLVSGLEAEFERVDSELELRRTLDGTPYDLVLSDYQMPGFSGDVALKIVRSKRPELPFIFVSGTIGEDIAVQALQNGAIDYILKHNPVRLPAAAARAVREARLEQERAMVEKELLRSQRMDCLAMLAAGLSHDLRNVLQPLLIVPDLLSTYSEDARVHKLGKIIAESVRRGHDMTESMLSFVKGSRNVGSEVVKIHELLDAIEMLMQGTLRRGVTLRLQVPDEEFSVRANFTEFQQCVLNLCINAVHAMQGRGGEILLSVEAHPDSPDTHLLLRVSDQGVGMSDEVKQRLFTPFYTTKPNGTGLGLMSCKRFIDGVGGGVRVESTLGEGSEFILTLPRYMADAEPALADRFVDGGGRLVMVVDEDATRLPLIANALSAQGYLPLSVADGAAALRSSAEVSQIDLIIVDSDLSLMSAATLLTALRNRGVSAPVIALQEMEEALPHQVLPETLVNGVVAKPPEIPALFRAIQNVLDVDPPR
ncbi:response regulator [Pseudoxanthomonas dokdonensis]